MRIALVGAELEENLALRSLHAAVMVAGHEAALFDFHAPGQTAEVVRQVVTWRPDLVGFSMVFTARGREFVELGLALRKAGYRGHLTSGGHFAAFHAAEILRDFPGLFDTIVHGEGEETLVDLAAHLDRPGEVAGLSLRGPGGEVVRTPPRPALDDLDAPSRPPLTRPEQFQTYLGLPIANMLSGRGCFGSCRFCSIHAWYRESPGRRFRVRHVERVAEEMARLYHERGVRIYNFHDDNFFLPRPEANLARFSELRGRLDRLGVGRIGIQVKARPDSIRQDVVAALVDLGCFRVFLGVENNAVAGLEALGRGIRRPVNHEALGMLLDAGMHTQYNLLMFEPDATLSDLRDNVDFIRAWPEVPCNFGRVEAYTGTALERDLRAAGRLRGDYFGWTYRLADDRAEVAYELFRRVFLARNFDDGCLNLRAMRLDYYFHVLRHFFPDRADAALRRRVKGAIRRLNEHSVQLLDEILDFAGSRAGLDAVEAARRGDRLAPLRADVDRAIARRMGACLDEIRRRAGEGESRGRGRLAGASAAAASLLLVVSAGCDDNDTHATEMMPPPQKEPARPEAAPAEDASRPMTAEETEIVQRHFVNTYQDDYDLLAGRFSPWNRPVTVHLAIGADGKVVKCEVEPTPNIGDKPEFVADLCKMAQGWMFADVKQAGTATLTLVGHFPERWAPCEYMERPHKPEN